MMMIDVLQPLLCTWQSSIAANVRHYMFSILSAENWSATLILAKKWPKMHQIFQFSNVGSYALAVS